MDVGRIEPVSPYKINWQKLTAKEIIKYEQEGVEVPTQYITWAQEFQRQIADSGDETTYEAASGKVSNANPSQKTNESSNSENNVDETSETETDENASNTEGTSDEPQKTEAQLKREEMIQNGDSLFKQGRTFRKISKQNRKEMKIGEMIMNAVSLKSTDEITKLDNDMNNLMGEIQTSKETIKAEIQKTNEGKGDLSNINKNQEKLEKLGHEGMRRSGETQAVLHGLEQSFNEIDPKILSSADFAVETVNIGRDIASMEKNFFPFTTIIGQRTIKIGEKTISASLTTAEARNNTKSINDANIAHSSDYDSEISEATGVENPRAKKEEKVDSTEENKKTKEEKSQETETEKAEKGESKAEKVATNDGNDNQDKLNTDLNEILKRKIRKGENIEPDNTEG